ncbi:MAG: DNA-binding protein Alba [Candidatus Pacearchaeota archaeon]
MAEEKSKKEEKDENVVYISNKPFMNYVTGVVMQFTTKNSKEVTIKARGKFISRAVDVAEVVKRKFLKEQNLKTKDIKIDSEEFTNKEGKKVNVSTIEITLAK